MKGYDVWTKSELPPHGWDRYTEQPFPTEAEARRWVQRYIPQAEIMILPRNA